MQISEIEIEHRKKLFTLHDSDIAALKLARILVENNLDDLVNAFYELQTSSPEISLLIGDLDTLDRLRRAQRRYITDLFSGQYDQEYVNNRLRIGMVHKRIGVEPKLYLSAIYTLKIMLNDLLCKELEGSDALLEVQNALEKLLLFDITLVFDTYIRSLVSEIEVSRDKTHQYARELEDKVKERTHQLEELSRTDPLTGLLNTRHMAEKLTRVLKSAERRSEPVSFVYIDVNDFKQFNDQEGHQRGDEVLKAVSSSLMNISRSEDRCFRYGGDEFCVVLPNCTYTNATKMYKARLLEELHKNEPGIMLSIGIAQTGPDSYRTPDALIMAADKAMYEDKKHIKSRHAIPAVDDSSSTLSKEAAPVHIGRK